MTFLVKKLLNNLKKKKLSISVAESCTGGLLSSTLTSFSGASNYFTYGLVTYSNQSKTSLLKIPKNFLIKNGSVSKKTSIFMVKNLNKISKADISISVTGIAGPAGGTPNKPVGLVYLSLKFKKKIITKKLLFKKKNRKFIQKETVKKALKLINNSIAHPKT